MLGIYYASQAPFPWLVMELLESNLKSYLENHTAEMVPFSTKISILSDVAQGLDFLHNRKDIIHKGLTSNNILLTRHQPPDAKIGDLRVALIVREQYRITYQNMRQDTLIFMPPEVFELVPRYDKPMDVFSLACIALHVMSHQWLVPRPYIYSITEVQRRYDYLQLCNPPSLNRLIQSCLHNNPECRLSISDVSTQLNNIKDNVQSVIFTNASNVCSNILYVY